MNSRSPSERNFIRTFFQKYGVLLIVLFVTTGVLIGTLWFQIPHMVAAALAKKLDVPVTIRRVAVSWNKISFYDLWIGNPEGYSLPHSFQVATVEIKAPLTTYFSSSVRIEEIVLRDIYLGFEFLSIKGPQGNWSVIMASLEAPKQSPIPIKLKRKRAFRSIGCSASISKQTSITEISLRKSSNSPRFQKWSLPISRAMEGSLPSKSWIASS